MSRNRKRLFFWLIGIIAFFLGLALFAPLGRDDKAHFEGLIRANKKRFP